MVGSLAHGLLQSPPGGQRPAAACAGGCGLSVALAGIPATAVWGSGCTYANGVVTLNLAADHVVRLLVAEGRIKFADLAHYQFRGPCGSPSIEATLPPS
jgi:hypothetical protein